MLYKQLLPVPQGSGRAAAMALRAACSGIEIQDYTHTPSNCILARTAHQAESRNSEFLFGELQQCIVFHILSFDTQLLLAENYKHVPKHMRRKRCLQLLKKQLWRRNGAL